MKLLKSQNSQNCRLPKHIDRSHQLVSLAIGSGLRVFRNRSFSMCYRYIGKNWPELCAHGSWKIDWIQSFGVAVIVRHQFR